ncbi:hypothetical protein Trco_003731 [Trichoderma cornu-damae]|uniref:Protein kinase domain-containing protein n=1 Tax=Trichoderma cornu-damae TaxID=654480 RepID=A0A9P8TWF6_9HYPO|nr:hypothetical protein Trco_003731 [Trichoderma cornu-damae]
MPLPPLDRYTAERYRLRTMSKPFLNNDLMQGPARFRGYDFKNPRLRRCVFDPDSVVFESRIGGGDDGFVWKVRFGDEGPFVLKIFWDQVPPRESGAYYPMQRECQNAAVIQMLEASVTSEPVLVYQRPLGKQDAASNYAAFWEENRPSKVVWKIDRANPPPGTEFMSSTPRMTKCYGWLKLRSDLWTELPADLQPSHEDASKVKKLVTGYTGPIGVVYELVQDGENEPCVVEEVDNFLWQTGFAYTVEPRARSWKSGILIDHAEIVHTRGYGWSEDDYMNRTAEQIVKK